jgi:hypothetical protein
MLWDTSQGALGPYVNPGVDIRQIPLYARLKDLIFKVPSSNADNLIYGIRFSERFDSSPFSPNKKLNVGFWIWHPNSPCIWEGDCSQVISVSAPTWSGAYPKAPGSNVVKTFFVSQVPGQNISQSSTKDSSCPASWWIEPNPDYGVIYFQLSITCLKIPANFYTYAYSGADVGISPIPYNFTGTIEITNPVWYLAKNSYVPPKEQKDLSVSGDELGDYESGDSRFLITCQLGTKRKKLYKNKPKCPAGYKLVKKIRL